MRRATFVSHAGVVMAASAAASAYAAPPWSDPQPVGAPARAIDLPTIAFASNGTALMSRRVNDSESLTPEQDRDLLSTLSPAGDLTEKGRVPDHLAAPPVLLPRGRVALLREPIVADPNKNPRTIRLSLSVGTLARPVPRGKARRIARYTRVPSDANKGPVMAAGPGGRLAIVWMTYRGDEFGTGRYRVRLAVRRPDGRFERTRTVAAGKISSERDTNSVAVAFAHTRDVVVAYEVDGQRRSDIRVRTLRRGRRLDRPQVLGPHAGLSQLRVAAGRDGRAIVAWATQDSGEEADVPSVVRAAIREPGGSRFGSTRVIDPGEATERMPGRLCLAMAPDGSAVLAWSNVRGRLSALSYPVRASTADAGEAFGPVAVLAANGAVADATARADGAMLVAWRNPDDPPLGPAQAYAALRAGPAQPFGSPELITESAPAQGIQRRAAAAFDPLTGRPTVVSSGWVQSADTLRLSTRIG